MESSVAKAHIRVNRKVGKRELPIVKLNKPVHREDVLYDAKGEFFPGEGQVRIINKLNRFTNSNRTVALCEVNGVIVEKTSDNITKLIGQNNYDLLISALCSVFSQELKIRGIHSLLTLPKRSQEIGIQADFTRTSKLRYDASSQTDSQVLNKKQLRKPVRRKLRTPYVIEDTRNIKKIVIDPEEFKEKFDTKARRPSFEHVAEYLGENSNDSNSRFSVASWETLINDPCSLLKNIDKHIKSQTEAVNTNPCLDQSGINAEMPPNAQFSEKPDSDNAIKYHEYFSPIEQKKMLLKIAVEEWKISDIRDEDGNLPLHVAVMETNLLRVKRMCHALNSKKISVDTPGAGGWTALKLSLNQDSPGVTEMLLRCGADPLLKDEEDRNAFHYAAESPSGHLNVLVSYCVQNARLILEQSEDLWKPHYEKMPDAKLSNILLKNACGSCDDQGYTPLMLASKLGRNDNVKLLLEVAPSVLNKRMSTSGNTALYLAVDAAYTDALGRGNKTKLSDNYRQTLESLVENGANPSIENYSGIDVNNLLTELNVPVMSMLVANKLTSRQFGNPDVMVKNFDEYMLVKEEENILITDINEGKPTKRQKNVKAKINSVENIIDQADTSDRPITVKEEIIHVNNRKIIKKLGNVKTNKGIVRNNTVEDRTKHGNASKEIVSLKERERIVMVPRNIKIEPVIVPNDFIEEIVLEDASGEYIVIREEESIHNNDGKLVEVSRNIRIEPVIAQNDVTEETVDCDASNEYIIVGGVERKHRNEEKPATAPRINQIQSEAAQSDTEDRNYTSDVRAVVSKSPVARNVMVVKGRQVKDIKIEVSKTTHKRKLQMTNDSTPSKVKPN